MYIQQWTCLEMRSYSSCSVRACVYARIFTQNKIINRGTLTVVWIFLFLLFICLFFFIQLICRQSSVERCNASFAIWTDSLVSRNWREWMTGTRIYKFCVSFSNCVLCTHNTFSYARPLLLLHLFCLLLTFYTVRVVLSIYANSVALIHHWHVCHDGRALLISKRCLCTRALVYR